MGPLLPRPPHSVGTTAVTLSALSTGTTNLTTEVNRVMETCLSSMGIYTQEKRMAFTIILLVTHRQKVVDWFGIHESVMCPSGHDQL